MSEIIAGLVLLQPFADMEYGFMDGCVCVRTHTPITDDMAHILYSLNWNGDDDNLTIWWHK